MQRLLTIVIALMFALGSLAGAGEAAKTTLAIEGMTCGGCAAAVKLHLKRTEGVTAYEVSYEQKRAVVTYDSERTTPQKIAESVATGTGYKVTVVASADKTADAGPHHAGAKCDGDCCKRPATAAQAAAAQGLTSLARDVSPLVSQFNNAKTRPRFLTILSPTCSACVHGAEAIKSAILAASADRDVFVVWTPMLAGDDADEASRASASLVGPRVRQYWDPERRVGTSFRKDLFPDAASRMRASVPSGHPFAEHLGHREDTQPEWDIYMFYDAGASWRDRAPAPTHWVRQTARLQRDGKGLISLMWIDDYAHPPVEGSLTEQLRRLVNPEVARAGQ
jgi:mercuric ion binding protein